MHVALVTLLLIAATSISTLMVRSRWIPVPLLQIAIGTAIALAGFHLELDPDVFMLLFIAPLLFADASLMPTRELRALRGPILSLALGLVLFSTLVCGWLVNWFEPGVPLAAAFALAAVLSPTDAVAVGSMLEGSRAPRRILHILAGEALLNDASGLVCFKFAVFATMAGSFKFSTASADFVRIVAGGVAAGLALGWLATRLESALTRRGFHNPSALITLVTLLPFGAYLSAERMQASGILAAVMAGIAFNRFGQYTAPPQVRLSQQVVWSLVGLLFNGIIFLLLGLQLPQIVSNAIALSQRDKLPAWRLPEAIILLTLTLILLRLLWIRAALAVRWASARVRGGHVDTPSLRLTLAMAVAGVRGAITLAAILSLPLASASGPAFPHRGLLIAVAAGVIICSMILAVLLLPLLVGKSESPDADLVEREIGAARVALARAGFEAVLQFRDKAPPEDSESAQIAASVLAEQQRRLDRLATDENVEDRMSIKEANRVFRRETALRLRAVRAQRASLANLVRAQSIDDAAARQLLRELDIEESSLLTAAQSTPKPRPA